MQKPPLYRKVNTTARGVHHNFGGDFGDQRNAKSARDEMLTRRPLHGKVRRGLDYTPLFRFLLSRVGSDWSSIHGEAVSRLDRPDPIYWLVARQTHERRDYVCVGESSYYSGLYIDDDNKLQLVNPILGPSSLSPQCKCCTHTFNGSQFTQSFKLRIPATGVPGEA